jgi:hypothetical protein
VDDYWPITFAAAGAAVSVIAIATPAAGTQKIVLVVFVPKSFVPLPVVAVAVAW